MIVKASDLASRLRSAGTSADPLVIVPAPPDLDALAKSGAASIDLRLGTWFVSLRQARMRALEVDDRGKSSQLTKTHYVPLGGDYVLHPRSFVLSVTLEWVCLPTDLGAYVIGRSSWGRRGLVIATATGVHPGFKGCLTLELTNLGEIPIVITPGSQICQLFFHRATGEATQADQSAFVGYRRPVLGTGELDPIAKRLRAARKPKDLAVSDN